MSKKLVSLAVKLQYVGIEHGKDFLKMHIVFEGDTETVKTRQGIANLGIRVQELL